MAPCKIGLDFDIYVHHGAGAYICGERKTALLESLEGKKRHASDEASVPAGCGSVRLPDNGDNVESIACGANDPCVAVTERFQQLRAPNNAGTKALFAISGHVNKPLRRRRSDEHLFRRTDRKTLPAVSVAAGQPQGLLIPGGSQVPMIPGAQMRDAIMDFDYLAPNNASGALVTAACNRMDNSHRCGIPSDLASGESFYKARNLRPCTRCREGTGWMMRVMDRPGARRCKPRRNRHVASMLTQTGRRPHDLRTGDAAAWPIQGFDPAPSVTRSRSHQQQAYRPRVSAVRGGVSGDGNLWRL